MQQSNLGNILKTWNKLSKFRLSVMNAAMPLVGCYSAYGLLSPKMSLILFTGNLCLAMSSQINGQLYERDFDKLMARTCNRPLVTDKVTVVKARLIAWSLYISGNAILAGTASWESVLISNVTFWSYFVYMWLKRHSKWSLPFGGIVGCLPILAGATVFAGFSGVNEKVIFDMIFMYFWQMTHFLQILIMNKGDYTKANFVMLESKNNIFYFQIFFLLMHILLILNLPGNEIKEKNLKAILVFCLFFQLFLLPNFRSGIAQYSIVMKEKKLAYAVAFFYFAFYHSKKFSNQYRLKLLNKSIKTN